MKTIFKLTLFSVYLLTTLVSCKKDKDNPVINLKSFSKTPSFFKLKQGFEKLNVYSILSSEDTIKATPNFVYGSMADGSGMFKNNDNTYTLINNVEADYSVARINFDANLKPISGEYILNAEATGYTAQCSGSLVTPKDHGFGPLYLSGGEWGGDSKGVFVTQVTKSSAQASQGNLLKNSLGAWSVENAVVLHKNAYPNKTVVVIGDDTGANDVPRGDLGFYVGERGDLYNGKLYGLKILDDAITYEADMKEGKAYAVSFIELEEREYFTLEEECRKKGVIGFSRVEDIDWRKGDANANREVYFCVTGRNKPDLVGKGTVYGRVYKLELNPENPIGQAKLTCVLDGDKKEGVAKEFLSPDNIVVTANYAYIQEDPNYKNDPTPNKGHYASLYQYNLNSGELKKVLECDQVLAQQQGYGKASTYWEITGMLDVSDIIDVPESFLLITQNHGWEKANGTPFTDPKANSEKESAKEGSVLYLLQGLAR